MIKRPENPNVKKNFGFSGFLFIVESALAAFYSFFAAAKERI